MAVVSPCSTATSPSCASSSRPGDLELAFGNKGQGPGELGTDTGGDMYFSGVYLLPWPDGSLSVLELIPATAHGKLVVADEQTYQMWILDDTERRRSGNGHWGDGVLIQRRMARYSIVVSMIAISTRRLRPRAASVVSATSGIDLPIPCIVTMPASTPASTR